MSKKVMLVALSIALVAALVGGATMAWFTDSDTSEPVEFAAGTVLIEAGSSSINSQYFDAADGVFVYGVEGNSGDLYEIDVQNGLENKIYDNPKSYSGYYPNGLAFDEVNDRLYFAASKTGLYFYDFSADKLVSAGTFPQTGKDVYGATFGGGYFWYIPNGTGDLYKVSFNSDGTIAGESHVTMTDAPGLQFGDVVIAYDDGIIYGSSTSFYFTYDTDEDIFTRVGTAGKDLQLAWGHDGILYGHNTGSLNWYTVVPATGATEKIFTGVRAYNDLAPGSTSYWNPGDSAWAKFNVKNVGTKNSYVRLEVSGRWLEYDEDTEEWVEWAHDATNCPDDDCNGVEVIEIGLSSASAGSWREIGGRYYYEQILGPNQTTELSLDVLLKGPETCNAYQGKRFELTGIFDAIQTTHDAPAQNGWDWPVN
jgi:predicted ribosomally synthesized peptide with SipW-like signal peptide